MAHDYDEVRKNQDFDFKIRGETFTIQQVKPEVIAAFAEENPPEGPLNALKWTDDHIKMFLDGNGAAKKWDEIRAQDANAVSQAEMEDILRRMIRVNTELPTEPSSPSAPGRGRTAASSKAG